MPDYQATGKDDRVLATVAALDLMEADKWFIAISRKDGWVQEWREAGFSVRVCNLDTWEWVAGPHFFEALTG